MNDAGTAPAVISDDVRPRARFASQRTLAIVFILAIALGFGLRLKHYFARYAFWHDEASLVLNVFDKSAGQLLEPLDWAQAAPPAFLMVERAVYLLLGRSELAMRLPPLLAALFGLMLFAHLARRTFENRAPWIAILVIALWVCSERLVWHSAEAKQYSFDVLVSLAMLLIALQENLPAKTRVMICAAIAIPAIWFSYATAFIFGGISLALAPTTRLRRQWMAWLACNTAFAVSLLMLYFVCMRDQQVNDLYAYWARDFVDFHRPWLIPFWLVRQAFGLANYPLDLGGPLLFPMCVVGGWVLWQDRRRQMLAILVAPALLLLVAATLHQYPFSGSRLTLFLAPNIFLLTGIGVVALVNQAKRDGRWTWLAAPIAGYLAAVAGWHAYMLLLHPPVHGNMPAAVRYIAAHDAPGDIIYVNKLSEFKCYWPNQTVRPTSDLSNVEPPGRFWLVVSSQSDNTNRDVKRLMAQVDSGAQQLDSFTTPGASVLLFDGVDPPTTQSTP